MRRGRAGPHRRSGRCRPATCPTPCQSSGRSCVRTSTTSTASRWCWCSTIGSRPRSCRSLLRRKIRPHSGCSKPSSTSSGTEPPDAKDGFRLSHGSGHCTPSANCSLDQCLDPAVTDVDEPRRERPVVGDHLLVNPEDVQTLPFRRGSVLNHARPTHTVLVISPYGNMARLQRHRLRTGSGGLQVHPSGPGFPETRLGGSGFDWCQHPVVVSRRSGGDRAGLRPQLR